MMRESNQRRVINSRYYPEDDQVIARISMVLFFSRLSTNLAEKNSGMLEEKQFRVG
jgi:hypothetical protein